jgi:hypothetical protein
MYHLGQATAYMTLETAGLGIGSGHSAVMDQQQAQRVLRFPERYLAVHLIGLGYPADRPLRSSAGLTAGHSMRSCTGTTGNTPTGAIQANLATSRRPGDS